MTGVVHKVRRYLFWKELKRQALPGTRASTFIRSLIADNTCNFRRAKCLLTWSAESVWPSRYEATPTSSFWCRANLWTLARCWLYDAWHRIVWDVHTNVKNWYLGDDDDSASPAGVKGADKSSRGKVDAGRGGVRGRGVSGSEAGTFLVVHLRFRVKPCLTNLVWMQPSATAMLAMIATAPSRLMTVPGAEVEEAMVPVVAEVR